MIDTKPITVKDVGFCEKYREATQTGWVKMKWL